MLEDMKTKSPAEGSSKMESKTFIELIETILELDIPTEDKKNLLMHLY